MLLADLVIIKLFTQLQKVENLRALNLLVLLVHLNLLVVINLDPFQAAVNQVQVVVQVHRLRKQAVVLVHQLVVTNQGLFQTQSQTQVAVQVLQVVVRVVQLPLVLNIITDLKDPIYQYRYRSLGEAVTLAITDHSLDTVHHLVW
ncbi:hypothetical protein CFB3_15960 [Clostridium folliculivorans]|uniref:Uncharacterized protein n=1 Tax=Clostridium folliculivorans TaxID=2886038 RepID=A0A9W6D964_9CLOT|nr:hypothetical protein CFOLD11_01990 [Clostridium folliculivorans]GKU29490.1 hypothetical protein CFB3_15960 [Clostridium folliculivorans]